MLKILIINDTLNKSSNILKELMKIGTDNIYRPNKHGGILLTETTEYRIVSKECLRGYRADQIISDGMYNGIDNILINSCVPKEYQIIYSDEILGGE